MVFRCGSLSHISIDDGDLPSVLKSPIRSPRSPGGGGKSKSRRSRSRQQAETPFSLNKQSRTPLSQKVFKKISNASSSNNNDPLKLVGSDLLVKEYPLAVLERRNFNFGGDGDRKSSEHDDDDDRLHGLKKIIYQNDERSLSEGTIASIRKRGLNQINNLLSSTSFSSNKSNTKDKDTSSQHNIYTTQTSSSHNNHLNPLEDYDQRAKRQILKKVHGKNIRSPPVCPKCSGNLTYLYMLSSKHNHKRNHRTSSPSTVCEIQYGNESTTTKFKNLLPPLCITCRTHLLFENSDCQHLMMENFNEWVDSGNGDDDGSCTSESEFVSEREYNFNDPRNAKLIVVNDSNPKSPSARKSPMKTDIIHIATSFGESQMMEDGGVEGATPRRSNTSQGEGSQEAVQSRFDFPDEMSQQPPQPEDLGNNPIFSGLSSFSDGPRKYRRKKDHYDHNNSREEVQQDQQRQDSDVSVHSTTTLDPESKSQLSNPNNTAVNVGNKREGISPDYFSDEDPFSQVEEVGDSDKEDAVESGVDDNAQCQAEKTSADTPSNLPDVPSTDSTSPQNVHLIHTESEEYELLSRYSMK